MSDLRPSEQVNEILRGIDGIVDSAHQADRTNPAARYDELLKQHGYTGIHDYLQKAGKPDVLDRVESSTIRDYLDGTITPQTLVEQMSTNDHMVDLFSAVSQFINTDSTDEEPPQPADTQRPSPSAWAEDDGDFSDETWLEDGL